VVITFPTGPIGPARFFFHFHRASRRRHAQPTASSGWKSRAPSA